MIKIKIALYDEDTVCLEKEFEGDYKNLKIRRWYCDDGSVLVSKEKITFPVTKDELEIIGDFILKKLLRTLDVEISIGVYVMRFKACISSKVFDDDRNIASDVREVELISLAGECCMPNEFVEYWTNEYSNMYRVVETVTNEKRTGYILETKDY